MLPRIFCHRCHQPIEGEYFFGWHSDRFVVVCPRDRRFYRQGEFNLSEWVVAI